MRNFASEKTAAEIGRDPQYKLGEILTVQPSVSILTPFAFAAFLYASQKAKYIDWTTDDTARVKANNCLTIFATAFSESLHFNDEMVVVLKQDGKIIRPVTSDVIKSPAFFAELSKPHTEVARFPSVGYRTSRAFDFSMASLNLHSPFTVVVANAVVDGSIKVGETTWTVNPEAVR